jgi:hypothetical protein
LPWHPNAEYRKQNEQNRPLFSSIALLFLCLLVSSPGLSQSGSGVISGAFKIPLALFWLAHKIELRPQVQAVADGCTKRIHNYRCESRNLSGNVFTGFAPFNTSVTVSGSNRPWLCLRLQPDSEVVVTADLLL